MKSIGEANDDNHQPRKPVKGSPGDYNVNDVDRFDDGIEVREIGNKKSYLGIRISDLLPRKRLKAQEKLVMTATSQNYQ